MERTTIAERPLMLGAYWLCGGSIGMGKEVYGRAITYPAIPLQDIKRNEIRMLETPALCALCSTIHNG